MTKLSRKIKSQGMTVTLGRTYTDSVTGFAGIATALCQYLTGCDQVNLTMLKDGDTKCLWVDVIRLENVNPAKAAPTPGGPQATPPARSHP